MVWGFKMNKVKKGPTKHRIKWEILYYKIELEKLDTFVFYTIFFSPPSFLPVKL